MKELRRNEWITITTAATRLATNPALIRQWIHRHKIARKGRLVLYADVENIDAKMRGADS